MQRIYHPVDLWEEIPANMWGEVDNRNEYLDRAIVFTSNHKLYGSYMNRVVREWRYSCENALTDPNLNRKAWVGHAAVALAFGCPEDITRKAWGRLTHEQQLLANAEAARSILWWEHHRSPHKELHRAMAEPVLFGGHT